MTRIYINNTPVDGDLDVLYKVMEKLIKSGYPVLGAGYSVKKEPMHFSKTTGRWMAISQMNSEHIKNVLITKLRETVENLTADRKTYTPAEFVDAYPILQNQDQETEDMLFELANRKDDE